MKMEDDLRFYASAQLVEEAMARSCHLASCTSIEWSNILGMS